MTLSVEGRKLVGRDIQRVEFGWPLGMTNLHGFIKKTQKTPAQDLRLALKRAKEMS